MKRAGSGQFDFGGEPDGYTKRPVPPVQKAPRRGRHRRRTGPYRVPEVEILRFRCIECGLEVERTSRPSDWPTHRAADHCDVLLLLPADDAQRRRWAREIAHVEGLQRERAQARLFAVSR